MRLESTFDALHLQAALPFRFWHQQDDIVHPFHDDRSVAIETVWTFDLDWDILRFDKKNQNLWVPLDLVRQRSVTISDFKPYEPPTIPEHTLVSFFSQPHWKAGREGLDLQCLERRKAFVSRVLTDFAFQWRHVLRGRYNTLTFRRLACAIIRITTLDFTVKEGPLRHVTDGFLVWLHNLPEWDPFSGHIVRVGGMSIVICQQIPHAVNLLRKDFLKQKESCLERGSYRILDEGFVYLILSVREIILYRINDKSDIFTKAERLFDGTNPPSDEAMRLLLEFTQTIAPPTPIRTLPVELQDMILEKVSVGPIESARVGCMLNTGSSFKWKCGDRDIEREEHRRESTDSSPVESKICFGNYFSGIAYK
jgi:hypothetical protein